MPQPTLAPYGRGPVAVEVEGAGRSKAQLIVGIDFVRLLIPVAEVVLNLLDHRELPSRE